MKQIKNILIEWKKEARSSKVLQFKYVIIDNKKILRIFTSDCEKLIGCAGNLVDKYKEILKQNGYIEIDEIIFFETDSNTIY